MKDTVCFYHTDCYDGLGAAYAVWSHFNRTGRIGEIDFVPVFHKQKIVDDLTDKELIIVDFCFPQDVMESMIDAARSVTLLDHHIKPAKPIIDALNNRLAAGWQSGKSVHLEFDNTRSGALMAWEHYHGAGTAPGIIRHISDRDLWKFALPHTREIIDAVATRVGYDLQAFVALANLGEGVFPALIREGEIIGRRIQRDIENVIRSTMRMVEFEGFTVPMINCPYWLASDALAQLALEHPFAISYFDTEYSRVFSLRSRKDGGEDVAELCMRRGGGGHKNAAGFRQRRYGEGL